MSHHPEKALAPGERLSSTSSISSVLGDKIGTSATSGADCFDEKVVESSVPTDRQGSIRGQAINDSGGRRAKGLSEKNKMVHHLRGWHGRLGSSIRKHDNFS